MTFPGRAVAGILIFSLGLAVGYGLARRTAVAPPAAPVPAAAAPARAGSTETRHRDPVVRLRVDTGDTVHGLLAGRVGDRPVLVVPVEALAGARVVSVGGDAGPRVAYVPGVAWQAGLVALNDDTNAPGLAVPASPGSLFIGRPVVALAPGSRSPGWVDSAAEATGGGGYRYRIHLEDARAGAGSPLVDPNSGELLGIIVENAPDGVARAVDSEAISRLLDEVERGERLSLAAFNEAFFTTRPEGMLQRLATLTDAGHYQDAIAVARNLRDLDWQWQETALAYQERAYQGASQDLLAQGRLDEARALLASAEAAVGENAERQLILAEIRRLQGDDAAAAAALRSAMRLNPALANLVLPRLRTMIANRAARLGDTASAEAITLLQGAIGDDSTHATYYEMLGTLQFRTGNYAAAIASLRRALELDPALEPGLRARIEQARQRLDTPALTEVPYDTQGNAILVDAYLNGADQPFRLVFDTGASYTAISVATALRLGVDRVFFGAPVVRLETANGEVYAQRATLASVNVGGATVRDVDVVILETMNGADGLLGLSYLNHFDVDINRSEGKLFLQRR